MGGPSAWVENNKRNIYEKIDVAKKTCQNTWKIKYKLKAVLYVLFVGFDACVRAECMVVCVCLWFLGQKKWKKKIVVLTSMVVVWAWLKIMCAKTNNINNYMIILYAVIWCVIYDKIKLIIIYKNALNIIIWLE